MGVHDGKAVHGVGVPEIRRLAVPLHRLLIILGNSPSEIEVLSLPVYRLGIQGKALLRRRWIVMASDAAAPPGLPALRVPDRCVVLPREPVSLRMVRAVAAALRAAGPACSLLSLLRSGFLTGVIRGALPDDRRRISSGLPQSLRGNRAACCGMIRCGQDVRLMAGGFGTGGAEAVIGGLSDRFREPEREHEAFRRVPRELLPEPAGPRERLPQVLGVKRGILPVIK